MKFDDTPRNYRLYLLELEDGKYYVGITSQTVEQRFREHQLGIKPAYWTNRYKPVSILHEEELGLITYEAAEAKEHERVLEYMKTYSVANVRGGDFGGNEEYGRIWRYVFTLHDRESLLILFGLLAVIACLLVALILK